MQTHRHASAGASLALRFGLAALALALLAACGGRAPPPSSQHGREGATVVVRRGDTVSAIARHHGVGLREMIAVNGLTAPYVIRPGQVLYVPGSLPPPVPVAEAEPAAPPIAGPAEGSSLGAPPALVIPASASSASAIPAPMTAPAPAPAAHRAVAVEALAPPGQGAAAEAAVTRVALPLPPPSPPAVEPLAARAEPEAETPRRRQRAERAPPRRRLAPGRFAWPVRGRVVSSFGSKGGGLVNDGLNIAAPRGTPVRAAADGKVIYTGNEVRGFGNLVLIQHAGGWVTAYGHTERILVRQGETVRVGEEIARVGSTGAVGSPQLHFQVRLDGKPVDPAERLESRVAGRSH